jgi:hypothetical protein
MVDVKKVFFMVDVKKQVFFMVDVKKVFFMVDVKKQFFFMVDVKKRENMSHKKPYG